MSKEQLLIYLDNVLPKVKLYLNLHKENLFLNRIKKFIRQPFKVVRVILFKKSLFNYSDVKVKMFWDKKYILPLWDDNMIITYYTSCFGFNEIPLVRYIIRNLSKNDIFYDIGSSFGLYAYLAEQICDNVYTFEPNKKTFEYISLNTKNKTKNENIALSDSSGVIEFYDTMDSSKSGMSSIFSDIASIAPKSVFKVTQVKSLAIDEYIINNKKPTFIKMDVMNADNLVIRGGLKFFTENSPIVAIRLYNTKDAFNRTKETLLILNEIGYKSYRLSDDGSINLFNIKQSELDFASTFIFKK